MIAPLCKAAGGGDQVKITCVCPTSASNITGGADGSLSGKTMLNIILAYIPMTINDLLVSKISFEVSPVTDTIPGIVTFAWQVYKLLLNVIRGLKLRFSVVPVDVLTMTSSCLIHGSTTRLGIVNTEQVTEYGCPTCNSLLAGDMVSFRAGKSKDNNIDYHKKGTTKSIFTCHIKYH